MQVRSKDDGGQSVSGFSLEVKPEQVCRVWLDFPLLRLLIQVMGFFTLEWWTHGVTAETCQISWSPAGTAELGCSEASGWETAKD